jgi:cysteine desulfuration protein SufE
MTLRERQDSFLEAFNTLPDWTEKFNFLISLASLLAPECPHSLNSYRIERCQSRTCFRADIRDGRIHADGWSNAAIMGGIIAACLKIFEDIPASDLACTEIDFHIRSGLVENMTPMRTGSLHEILRRITVLSPTPPKSHLCP